MLLCSVDRRDRIEQEEKRVRLLTPNERELLEADMEWRRQRAQSELAEAQRVAEEEARLRAEAAAAEAAALRASAASWRSRTSEDEALIDKVCSCTGRRVAAGRVHAL